jgi:hypothetical protein
MDDLIAYGTAGIVLLVIAAALILYGAFVLVMTAGQAIASGDFDFFLALIAAVAVVFFGYTATGLWLQKTNRI